jgi:hypothetical protein
MSRVISGLRLPPSCEICGLATVKIGKLPEVGLHSLLYVYKCEPCRQVISIKPSAVEAADAEIGVRLANEQIDRLPAMAMELVQQSVQANAK